MDEDQGLEDGGPCGLAQTLLQRPKDLGDPGLSRVCRNENVLDVFRLGSGELHRSRLDTVRLPLRYDPQYPSPTLDLVPPLTDFSKVLAIDRSVLDVRLDEGAASNAKPREARLLHTRARVR